MILASYLGKNSVVMRFGLLLISLLTLSFVAQGQESKSDVFVPISKYLEAGKAYVTANFSEMKFTECNECAYKEFELFKTANTVYSQYFLDEKEEKK